MTKNKVNIAIIGGGFSGTLATIRLVKLLTETQNAARIFLIEKTKRLAKGVAYDTQCDLHLLNVAAQDMSAFPEDRENFYNWLSQRYSAVAPSAFVSRKIYGEYVSELFQKTMQSLKGDVEVEVIDDEAIELSADEKHLSLASGRVLEIDRLVLATGQFQPNQVENTESLAGTGLYFNNPWAPEALEGLSSHDNILLIGTGLTMVDLAVQLNAAGHQGIITAISRHGLLPNKHRVFNRIEGATSEEFLPGVFPSNVRELFDIVRAACDKANASTNSDWRLVVNQLRPHTQSIWKNLSVAEKRRFLRHIRPLWDVMRHRMAPEVASVIESMREDYRLRIVTARLLTSVISGNAVEVTMRLRKSRRVQTATYRRIINCTGPNMDLRIVDDRLIKCLLENGAVVADELGMGLKVDDHGYAIRANGTRSESVLTLGPLRKGQLWESIAVPELRVQAAQLAEQIVRTLFVSEEICGAVAASSATAFNLT
ncbi:MAG TPA: FAD/NAD(P)-binding protein [Drouetiella sp.]|jgi:uncharacterized NAD(P)/FAD-binding protein YdhS